MAIFSCNVFSPRDLETGEYYAVSPNSGRLLVVPADAWEKASQRNGNLAQEDIFRIENYSPVSEMTELSLPPSPHTVRMPFIFRIALFYARISAKFLSLSFSIRAISWLSTSHSSMALDDIIRILRSDPAYSSASCLVRSLTQAVVLYRYGYAFDLFIGVWIPTTRMHAWVTVNCNDRCMLVDDTQDKVAHFQPALNFSLA